MLNSINITRRDRKHTLKSGAVVTQTRWVLNYSEPRTGKRRQLFFERHKDAQSKRNEVVAQIVTGSYADDRNKAVTIAEATRRWLANRQGEVKDGTLGGYRQSVSHITGPLLVGTLTPFHNISFIFKKAGPDGNTVLDRAGVSGFTQIMDNPRVRAWRAILEPGQSTGQITQSAPGVRVYVRGGVLAEVIPGNADRGMAPMMATSSGRMRAKRAASRTPARHASNSSNSS